MTPPPAAAAEAFDKKAYHTEKNHRAGHQIQATRLLFQQHKREQNHKDRSCILQHDGIGCRSHFIGQRKKHICAAYRSRPQQYPAIQLWFMACYQQIRTEHSQRNDAASAVKSHPTPRDQLHAKSGCTVQNCCQKYKHRSTAAHRHISSPFSAQKKNTHRPLHADRGRSQTRYHLWFTHILTHIGLMLCHHTACALSGASRPALLRLSVQAAAQRRIHKVHLSSFHQTEVLFTGGDSATLPHHR